MKHLLLILISLLLMSSPVIGNSHKGETLYGWGEYPNYVWKGFGDKETHPKYTGDVKNGKPNGLGFFITPSGEKYVGSWKNGEYHGEGTLTLPDGKKYVGEYNEYREWNVMVYDKNGNIIEKWVNGKWIKQ